MNTLFSAPPNQVRSNATGRGYYSNDSKTVTMLMMATITLMTTMITVKLQK